MKCSKVIVDWNTSCGHYVYMFVYIHVYVQEPLVYDDLFVFTPGDSTPLMEAASGGYADIVKLLIDHGANVNATSR